MVVTRMLLVCAAAACLAPVPPARAAAPSPPDRQAAQVEPGLLDGYAGYYLLADRAVLTVRREDDHLSIQLTGQPAAPVFPQSRTRFFARVVDAQFDFQTDAAGKVTGVVLRQNGADLTLPRVDAATAAQVAARTGARVRAQAASPGTEAAVRRLDASIAAGAPDYDAMSPAVAAAMRARLPRLKQDLASLGPIQEVRFLGVDRQGSDVYDVRHADGILRWTLALGADGKVATAWVAPGP